LRRAGRRILLLAGVAGAAVAGACRREPPPPEFPPDSVLRTELGLTDADEVHRVTIRGGDREVLDPVEVRIPAGAWVEFVTADWRMHQIRFVADSLDAAHRAFLEGTDQMDSPPLVDRDARFVVSFAEAPEGRYPFVAEGNEAPTLGVVVVLPKR
jgi:plastocyanin